MSTTNNGPLEAGTTAGGSVLGGLGGMLADKGLSSSLSKALRSKLQGIAGNPAMRYGEAAADTGESAADIPTLLKLFRSIRGGGLTLPVAGAVAGGAGALGLTKALEKTPQVVQEAAPAAEGAASSLSNADKLLLGLGGAGAVGGGVLASHFAGHKKKHGE